MKLIKRAFHSLFVRMLVGAMLIYSVVDFFLPQRAINTLLTAISLCLASAVAVMYWPSSREAFLKRDLASRERLVLGILLSWGARVILSAVALITLIFGRGSFTVDFNNTEYFGYVFVAVLLAAVFHVTAPALSSGVAPRRDWKSVIIAVAIGGLIAGFVLALAWMKLTGGEGL